jgi:acetyl esterase/lipase
MASWQAHALDMLMRVQVKRRIRRATTTEQARRILESLGLTTPTGVTFTPGEAGGITGEWTAVPGAAEARTLLYLHGGGYFACSPQTHRPVAAAYAKRGFRVFTPAYRLAPEHPFPAAIEDARAAWDGLVGQGHAPESLTVSGESAGGGLTLALLLNVRDAGQPLPAAAALFSPWTDLANTGASVVSHVGREAMLWGPGLTLAAQAYLNGADPKTPLASPYYGDLTGLPPLLIHVGSREVLLEDSRRLAERARAAGVHVELRVWPVVSHAWQLAEFVPEARESLDLAAEFLKKALLF